MKEKCECGNDTFEVWNDKKFNHIWLKCLICKRERDIIN